MHLRLRLLRCWLLLSSDRVKHTSHLLRRRTRKQVGLLQSSKRWDLRSNNWSLERGFGLPQEGSHKFAWLGQFRYCNQERNQSQLEFGNSWHVPRSYLRSLLHGPCSWTNQLLSQIQHYWLGLAIVHSIHGITLGESSTSPSCYPDVRRSKWQRLQWPK